MATPLAAHSKAFVLVIAGAIAAVFLEQIVRVTGVTGALFSMLKSVGEQFNLSPGSTTALTAVTRDVIVIGAVALLCLAVSLTLIVIYTYSSDDESQTILEPPADSGDPGR